MENDFIKVVESNALCKAGTKKEIYLKLSKIAKFYIYSDYLYLMLDNSELINCALSDNLQVFEYLKNKEIEINNEIKKIDKDLIHKLPPEIEDDDCRIFNLTISRNIYDNKIRFYISYVDKYFCILNNTSFIGDNFFETVQSMYNFLIKNNYIVE